MNTIRFAMTAPLLLALVGCADQAAPRPIQPVEIADVFAIPQPRAMSLEEQQLVNQIAAKYPEADSQIRTLLTDRRVASFDLPDDRAKALLAQLESVRARDRAVALAVAGPTVRMAKVVLVDQLRDSTADVMVVRRTRPAEDMIVLAEGQATGARLGAGIAALYKLRRQFGDTATQDMSLVVRNAKMPKSWPSELKAETQSVVARLRKEAKGNVRGLGDGRSVEIPLVSTSK